ncbi:MAG: hypothetical protein K0U59_02890 [Gammaproteobacteria bacterium]|nr:hypothetical protein [Gammaproteobacteria bacterium]
MDAESVSIEIGGKSYQNWSYEALITLLGQGAVDDALLSQEHNRVRALRLMAYKEESDPLYMEWQYDQTNELEQLWREKVAEIKSRYPLPGET